MENRVRTAINKTLLRTGAGGELRLKYRLVVTDIADERTWQEGSLSRDRRREILFSRRLIRDTDGMMLSAKLYTMLISVLVVFSSTEISSDSVGCISEKIYRETAPRNIVSFRIRSLISS